MNGSPTGRSLRVSGQSSAPSSAPTGTAPGRATLDVFRRDEPGAVQARQSVLGQLAQPVSRELVGDARGRGRGDREGRAQAAIAAHCQQGLDPAS